MPRTPKLKMPFSIPGAEAAVVEQDSVTEVTQNVEALLRTPVGSRIDEPEYGIPELTFREATPYIENGDLAEAIAEWEPRASTALSEEDIEDMFVRINAENSGGSE